MRVITAPSSPAPSTPELWVDEIKQERGKESRLLPNVLHMSLWEENHLGRKKILCGGIKSSMRRKSSVGRKFSIGIKFSVGVKSSGTGLIVLELLVEMELI